LRRQWLSLFRREASPRIPLADRQWLYLALGCWSAVWFVVLAHHGGIDWKFFTTGTSLLFGGHPMIIQGITGGSGTAGPAGLPGPPPPGGLHIFASYPALQMGPLAYLVTGLVRQLGPDNGLVAAELLLQAAGLAIVYLIEQIALRARPSLAKQGRAFPLTVLTGGAVFMVAWSELAAGFAHLDDGLALLLATLAVFLWGMETTPPRRPLRPVVARRYGLTWPGGPLRPSAARRPRSSLRSPRGLRGQWPAMGAGVCLGLAADAKPWALVFLPIVLIPVGQSRQSRNLRATAIAALAAMAVVAVAWLPFFIADSGTLHATRFLIRNEPNSALRALGVTQNYTPSWDRPAQILLGCGLGVLAIARRRWPAVLLLAGGARILLDPAAHSYYTPDIMVGALLWDLLGSGTRRPLPLWTLASFAALNLTPLAISNAEAQGAIRLALIAAFTATTLLAPIRPRKDYATGSPPRQTRLGASPYDQTNAPS
jgi:hypothetical protein